MGSTKRRKKILVGRFLFVIFVRLVFFKTSFAFFSRVLFLSPFLPDGDNSFDGRV